VDVTRTGYHPGRYQVLVAAGDTAKLKPLLKAVQAAIPEPDPVIREPAASGAFEIAGWTSLATGLVSIGTGSGLWSWAGSIESDLEALAADPARIQQLGSEQAYYDYYDPRNEKRQDMDTAGAVLIGVGGSAALAGAVLLVLDATSESESESESESDAVGLRIVPMVGPVIGAAAILGF
jgi:hypothetical protein